MIQREVALQKKVNQKLSDTAWPAEQKPLFRRHFTKLPTAPTHILGAFMTVSDSRLQLQHL